MLFLALFSCIGATWVHKFVKTCERYSRVDTQIFCACYWIPLITTAFVHFWDSDLMIPVGIGFFLCWTVFVVLFKYIMDKKRKPFKVGPITWKLYIKDFVCFGSMHLFENTLELSSELTHQSSWQSAFKYWWAISIKFFAPWVLWQLIFMLDIGAIFGKRR